MNSSCRVQPGDTVLTYAGAGGVGLLLLKLRGATVITTTSTPEKAELARDAGADHVLDYAEVPGRVRELTGGRGVDVVYDGIGKATWKDPWTRCATAARWCSSAAPRGRCRRSTCSSSMPTGP